MLFFAEPRYRLPIEILAFPFVALTLSEIVSAVAAAASRSRPRLRTSALRLGPALLLVIVWRLGWPAALDAGAALRARHRWAVTELAADGRMATLAWGPAPPFAAASPIAGAPNGVHVVVGPGAPTRVRLEVGGGSLAPGPYRLRVRLEAAGAPVEVRVSGSAVMGGSATARIVPEAPSAIEVPVLAPLGQRLLLEATLVAPTAASIWASDAALTDTTHVAPL
jgi:hypothetical protein